MSIFRRVRTLYACLAENEGELSFEPNQIIINGERGNISLLFTINTITFLSFSVKIKRARLVEWNIEWKKRSDT